MKNRAQCHLKLLATIGMTLGVLALTGYCQTIGDSVLADSIGEHRGYPSYIDTAVLKIDTVSDTLRPYAAPDLDLQLDTTRTVSWYLADTLRTNTYLLLSGVYAAGHYRAYLRTALIDNYLGIKSDERIAPCISMLMIDDLLIEQKVWLVK